MNANERKLLELIRKGEGFDHKSQVKSPHKLAPSRHQVGTRLKSCVTAWNILEL
jgi:hypothetical protein